LLRAGQDLPRKKRTAFGKQWRVTPRTPVHAQAMKKPNIRNILVPIDFSKMSSQAIETAKHLAQRFGADLHLVHVYQFHYPAGFVAPGMPPDITMFSFPVDEARKLAQRLKVFAHKHGIPSEMCHLLEGTPTFNEICRLAREINADLIVTPTHGHTGLKHIFLGSTAERIVQHSPCPVIVARQFKEPLSEMKAVYGVDKILVPVDFSACSLAGLKSAIQWADRFSAKILVLNVVDFAYSFTSDGYAMYDLSKYREMARKEAERQMRRFVRIAKFGPVKFETAVLVGPPVDVITAFAQNQNVDLIITATHGRTGFRHVLIGSTAELVIRHAYCSVLIVPSHPEVRTAHLIHGIQSARKPDTQSTKRKASPVSTERFTKRNRKLVAHPALERRKTNKFREFHSS
jgi:nucleotide-binding universal stress UspA family protein